MADFKDGMNGLGRIVTRRKNNIIRNLYSALEDSKSARLSGCDFDLWGVGLIKKLKNASKNAVNVDLSNNNLCEWGIDQIRVLNGAFPNAIRIMLGYNELGKWSAEKINALQSIFPSTTTVILHNTTSFQVSTDSSTSVLFSIRCRIKRSRQLRQMITYNVFKGGTLKRPDYQFLAVYSLYKY